MIFACKQIQRENGSPHKKVINTLIEEYHDCTNDDFEKAVYDLMRCGFFDAFLADVYYHGMEQHRVRTHRRRRKGLKWFQGIKIPPYTFKR